MIYSLYNAYYYYRYVYYSLIAYQSIKFSYDSYTTFYYIYSFFKPNLLPKVDIAMIEINENDDEWNEINLY